MPSTSGASGAAAPKKPKPMPKKQLAALREAAAGGAQARPQGARSVRRHVQPNGEASDGDLSAYSFHMADQGTDAMEREKAFLFASKEGRFLWHIDQALRRLYKSPETFGKCHQCGDEIAFERLDALPHARYCIKCKQREEDAKEVLRKALTYWHGSGGHRRVPTASRSGRGGGAVAARRPARRSSATPSGSAGRWSTTRGRPSGCIWGRASRWIFLALTVGALGILWRLYRTTAADGNRGA
jgi:DnaK suppressor protein